MTENNTGDRRFWMVVAELRTTETQTRAFSVSNDQGENKFSDDKDAHALAEEYASAPDCVAAYVVEAMCRYTMPEPKVTKINLHIPPLVPRDNN